MSPSLNQALVDLLLNLDLEEADAKQRKLISVEIRDAVDVLNSENELIPNTEENKTKIGEYLEMVFKRFPVLLTEKNQQMLQRWQFPAQEAEPEAPRPRGNR